MVLRYAGNHAEQGRISEDVSGSVACREGAQWAALRAPVCGGGGAVRSSPGVRSLRGAHYRLVAAMRPDPGRD